MRILLLEDELLIAMDVEQLCRDHGASEVVTIRSLDEIDHQQERYDFDAAIVDVMLDGAPTLDFAERLRDSGVPFVFASGYTDFADLSAAFPGVKLIGKPYSGIDLISAVAMTARESEASGGI